MALGATIYNFDIELADTDRHVYESLTLRVARHPSESEEYLVARLLAYLLEFAEDHFEKVLKKDARTKHIPVVIVTTIGRPHDEELLKKGGADKRALAALSDQLADLSAKYSALLIRTEQLEELADDMSKKIMEALKEATKERPLPPLKVKGSTSRAWGHSHDIDLAVVRDEG